MSDTNGKVSIAILGGGLAGAFLFRGLLKHNHFDVHLFESRLEFREEGAGIALSTNATSALKATDAGIIDCLDRAGAVQPVATDRHIAQGPDAGLRLQESFKPPNLDNDVPQRTCARQPFLRELLKGIPDHLMHSGKRLRHIDDSQVSKAGGQYVLHFYDDTIENFDVVFGADGTHGPTRGYVIGEDHPSLKPVCVGICSLPILVPFPDVQGVLGDFLSKDASNQSSWIGKDAYMLLDLHNSGETVQIVALFREPSKKNESGLWKKQISHEDFRALFSGMISHLSIGAVDAICANSSDPLTVTYVNNHLPTPSYVKGRVCLIGDAAHSTSPAMASGGGMSAEDACILSALLARTKTLEDVSYAFQAFDTTHRPRCEQIIAASNRTGNVMCGAEGLDPKTLNEYLLHAWDFIQLWRPSREIPKAIDTYETLLAKA